MPRSEGAARPSGRKAILYTTISYKCNKACITITSTIAHVFRVICVFMCKCLLLGTYPIMYMQTMYNHEMYLGGVKQQNQRLDAKAWGYDDFWGYNTVATKKNAISQIRSNPKILVNSTYWKPQPVLFCFCWRFLYTLNHPLFSCQVAGFLPGRGSWEDMARYSSSWE